jgi:hypothetical protein
VTRAVRIACVAALALVASARLTAQDVRPVTPSEADVAISEGRLADAEKLLFDASFAAAHDPAARGALGMFLASRGRLKVGAVLLDEARQFGGDPAVIDPRLARIDTWLGDWAAIAALKHYAAAGPLHERALWLVHHPSAREGDDSVTVALEPNEIAGLGRITLAVGGENVDVDIDPTADGLVLPPNSAVTSASLQFGMHDTTSVAVVYAVGIGGMRLLNVPARLSPVARPTIGLDILAPLMPAFDVAAHSLTLRQHPAQLQGDLLPIVLGFPGMSLVARPGQPLVSMESAAGRAALRGSRWTFDLHRGAIVLLP